MSVQLLPVHIYGANTMARVQLTVGDKDRSRYIRQARKESLTLSAWLRAAANGRLERNSFVKTFESVAELETFFTVRDNLDAGNKEPDWNQQLSVIDEVRRQGATNP